MVMIMALLAVSLMLVVGTMLVVNVQRFYNDDFLRQMEVFFDEETVDVLNETRSEVELFDSLSGETVRLGINTYRNFYIFNREGAYRQGSNSELGPALERGENLEAALVRGVVGDKGNIALNYMDYAYPLDDYVIYIKDSKDQVYDLIWNIVLSIIEIMFFTMIVAILLSFLLARTITNPIEKITMGAVRVAGGDFDPLPVQSQDEIGTLADTFNDMAETLQKTLGDIEAERNKYETIFVYLTDGVLVFDGAGLLNDANHTARNMLRVQLREGVTRFEQVFPPEAVPVDLAALRSGAEHNITRELVVGQLVLSATFAAFQMPEVMGSSAAEGVIAVVHDITDRQRLDQARREFIANVSHELRTPLTNIKSYTETVLENEDLPQENRISFLQVVLGESDRMIRIVKDLLTLSRLDNDKLELHFDRFDMAEMVEKVCEAMKIDAEHSGHSLTVELHNPGVVTGDMERLEQVLVNIISNSVKYTPSGGDIRVEAGRDGDTVLIRVTDNGIGIPQKDLGRIFDRFYRVDKARSRDMGGTGLGLAIAQEIIRAHNGDIVIDSRLGEGTTVTMLVPVSAKQR